MYVDLFFANIFRSATATRRKERKNIKRKTFGLNVPATNLLPFYNVVFFNVVRFGLFFSPKTYICVLIILTF